MSVYIVSRLKIRDPAAMKRYVEEVVPVVQAHGGRYLVRGSGVRALEGSWQDDRMVVLEFVDEQAALAWYNCAEYQELKRLRQNSAQAVILLAEGV